ncbi:GntR family transcriptional regulator [Nocardioides sp. GY 10127]|uniref:GntR family transcriptional regulator n=1 Tax=Nocardioides sp. GY 10127 TaxID=2569762 RepID=UPI0010A86857|nr:GntR family transcriptional regulator [Nocardioides sp. GY 10127]TIC81870.1 GntR family transcriptional regulator [Nocardioides sp. GY 10127]
MTLLPVDPASPEPASEQLRRQVADRAATGDLPVGTRLPPVRTAAEQLGLAANTVAKAYRALEAGGVVVAEGRRGTFVAEQRDDDLLRARAEALAAAAAGRGLSLAEAQRLLERVWPR